MLHTYQAQNEITVIKQDFDRTFKKNDVLITPTSPTTTFKLGEKIDDPSDKDSPIGLQIIEPHLSENLLLSVANTLENNFKK